MQAGTEQITVRRAPWAVVGLEALLLTSCGDGGEDGAAAPQEQPTADSAEGTEAEAQEEPEGPSAEEIAEHIAEAEWTFEDRGPDGPQTIQLSGGEAEDDLGRSYTMGEELIESDATGDGIVDIAVPLRQTDGNAVDEQWFIWAGQAAEDGEPPAEQVIYPIGRSTSCGDAVVEVAAAQEGGFEVQENFRHSMEDGPCAEPGPDELHKVVEVSSGDDGELLPVQTAPVQAWGGLCVRTDGAVSGSPAELRAFPGEEAPAVEAAWAEEAEAAEDSLLGGLAGDHGFFRFTPEGYEPEGETTVDQFCGFGLDDEEEQPEDNGDSPSGDRVNPDAYEMTGFDQSGEPVGWGFQTPSGRHSCAIFEGYDGEGHVVTCLMDWDDPEDLDGVPEDAMLYPVPSLSAAGGEIQFHGGIPFPGSPETTLAYGDVLEVEGIACAVEESGITCTAGDEWMEANGAGYEFSTDITP